MIRTAETYHVPVLLKESIDGLNINPDGIYVDVTFGGGGHNRTSETLTDNKEWEDSLLSVPTIGI